jgi:hypothetical protein
VEVNTPPAVIGLVDCSWGASLRANSKQAAAVVGCLALSLGAAHAADCKPLTRVASLDVTDSAAGLMLVSVGINGTPVKMIVGAGSPTTTIDTPTVKALQLPTSRIVEGIFTDWNGAMAQYSATVHELRIGSVLANHVQVLVAPGSLSTDGSIGGRLGADVLKKFDVELDFAHHKLNLFRPDHCPGVIYWPATAIAVVPMHVTRMGQIELSLTLDGKTIDDAVLETAANWTFLTGTAATLLFGLNPHSPDMAPSPSNLRARDVYIHTFKSLTLDGITIGNVPIAIFETNVYDAGAPELTLGLKELQRLHIYLAYGEGRMYATPADAASANTARN